MNRAVRFILIAGILIFALGTALMFLQGSRNRSALVKYKVEMRARGEKLSAGEFGYPRPPESTRSLDRLQAAINQIGGFRYHPGTLELTHFVGAGRAQICWALAQPSFYPPSGGKTNSFPPTWEEFSAQFESVADAMQEIREATETPPRYYYNDPTNFLNAVKGPFVLLRGVAQSLMGDAVAALHAQQLDRARGDLHALTQLAQFNHEDLTLVSQMIRTAIAGLGLAVTWEALQAQGWNEEGLATLQKDWEAINLADAFERGILGERAFGEAAFSYMRTASLHERAKFFALGRSLGRKTVEDYLVEFVAMPLWRANSETDELFFLQHHQKTLDAFRQLQHGSSLIAVNQQFNLKSNEMNAAFSPPLAKFRYAFSAIAIPNSRRAASTCTRHETQRRLTVTAIAIKRYRLQNGHSPPDLSALVPQFLSAAPMDLMSAKPMGYKLNADGGFVLYSVGEDGRDDGGDPNSSSVTNNFDLWSGRDAVWPRAVFDDQPTKK